MEMKKRLIDVLEFAKRCDRLLENPLHIHPGTSWQRGIDMAVAEAFLTRPVDAVEVVRCKDCKMRCPESVCLVKHCTLTGVLVDDDDFCSYGERREGVYGNT